MTETTEAVAENSEAVDTTPKRLTAPKTAEDVEAITTLDLPKVQEATNSYVAWLNRHASNIEGFTIPDQDSMWAIISFYRAWQSGPEREAEKKALEEAQAAEKARKAEEAEKRKAANAEKKAAAEEAKKRKAAEKAAKEAENGEDLDSVDAEGEGEIKTTKRRRRRPAATEDASVEETAEDSSEE